MYSVGDRLQCIKSYDSSEDLYTEGNIYIIESVREVSVGYDKVDYEVVLKSNNGFGYYFLIKDVYNEYYLYKYFMSIRRSRNSATQNIKECRRLKLEKLSKNLVYESKV